jgi:hypothetical protein
VRERRASAQGDVSEPLGGETEARRRSQGDGGIGKAGAKRDEGGAVAATDRVLEQGEDETLDLLDEPVGVQRVAVVDDDAQLVGDAMLANPPSQVLLLDRDGACRPAGPDGCRPKRGVDGDVDVPVAVEPMPGMLPPPHGDERPVTPSDRSTFVPVGTLWRPEHPRDVRVHGRDRRGCVERL